MCVSSCFLARFLGRKSVVFPGMISCRHVPPSSFLARFACRVQTPGNFVIRHFKLDSPQGILLSALEVPEGSIIQLHARFVSPVQSLLGTS